MNILDFSWLLGFTQGKIILSGCFNREKLILKIASEVMEGLKSHIGHEAASQSVMTGSHTVPSAGITGEVDVRIQKLGSGGR